MCEKCKESDYTVHGLEALNGSSRIFAGRTPCGDYYFEFKYKLDIDDFLEARDQIFTYEDDKARLNFLLSPDALHALLITIRRIER